MSARIPNISPATDLKPVARYAPEIGDTIINVDGCIEVIRRSDTDKARAAYAMFRKHLALIEQGAMTPEKHRAQAFLATLREMNVQLTHLPLQG